MITSQRVLRAEFWRTHPDLPCRRVDNSTIRAAQNYQPADTRAAWCDWVDALQREGRISNELAQRATL